MVVCVIVDAVCHVVSGYECAMVESTLVVSTRRGKR